MAKNPFYVQPGNDMSQGLAGLGSALQGFGQLKQQQRKEDEAKQRLANASQAAKVAMDSGDYDAMAKVMLDYPEMSERLSAIYGFKSDAAKQEMLDDSRNYLMTPVADREQLLLARAKKLTAEGRDASHTIRELNLFRRDPEASEDSVRKHYAFLDPKGYDSVFGAEKKSNLARQLKEAGYEPGSPEFQEEMRRQLSKPTGTTVNVGSGGASFEADQKLRKELMGLTKDYQQVEGYGRRVQAAAGDPSAAGDIALIFNYMKMLDPNSVVREGEFATAENAGGVSQQVRAQWNKLIKGERLTPDQRKQFVNQARAQYRAAYDQYKATTDRYAGLASGYGLDPENITGTITPLGGWDELMNSGIAIGTVQDDYRFKGGDPADPNSWESAQ